MRVWVHPHIRDETVCFVDYYAPRTGLAVARPVAWIGITRERFHQWRKRHGHDNQHNAPIPRDFWLLDSERQAIVAFHFDHPLEGYRRLIYMTPSAIAFGAGRCSTVTLWPSAPLRSTAY